MVVRRYAYLRKGAVSITWFDNFLERGGALQNLTYARRGEKNRHSVRRSSADEMENHIAANVPQIPLNSSAIQSASLFPDVAV